MVLINGIASHHEMENRWIKLDKIIVFDPFHVQIQGGRAARFQSVQHFRSGLHSVKPGLGSAETNLAQLCQEVRGSENDQVR